MIGFDFIIVFIILWWIVLFILLPIGIEKEENIEIGNDPGAPKNPMLKKKLLYSTIITFFLTLLIVFFKNEIF